MQLFGEPKARLNADAREFINLYAQLGERAENFLPNRIFESLKNFVRLCFEEPDDPARQQAEINKYILELKEAIPGYVDVQLMLFPHEDSKAFEYSARRRIFHNRLNRLVDQELVDPVTKKKIGNILNGHDFSIGTPPVTDQTIDFLYRVLLGDKVRELRKFRDLIGVSGDVEEAQWNYMLDVFDQMVNQSTHYTTRAEKESFLNRTESTVNFKGLNGFIRTIVSGTADTAIELLSKEVFSPAIVKTLEFTDPDTLYDQIHADSTSIFAVKIQNMRRNPFNRFRWFPLLARIIFIDDSPESRSTNTSLVFCFHNGIINCLNKVHTKKLGTLANTQLNLRLILDKVNRENLRKFSLAIERKIGEYEKELAQLKKEQLAEQDNPEQDIILFKFDEFARQVIRDKYILSKFGAYVSLVENLKDPKKLNRLNRELIREFEERTKAYFYSENTRLHLTTVVEGGGRNQIRTYGEYLLQRGLKPVKKEIVEKCRIILEIIPDNFQRTLKNHFHKNFGLNLFLEKYKEYLTKVENEADNQGRFMNFLIDLGVEKKYRAKSAEEHKILKEFFSALSNLDQTSVADDVQMIIRDLLFYKNRKPNPFIFFNQDAAWEYRDLFPPDRFDLNPFDIDIELTDEGRIDWERLQKKLERIKSTFQLFDETGNLWDRFCENSTLVINDPANPSGFTDFNNVALIRLLKFLNNSKITLFLDEAYQDSVKIEDPEEPKWRTISRYIMNNIGPLARISVVSSLSTTKNLAATGDRLGSLAATPARKDVIEFARERFGVEKGNTNSLYMLVNVLEVAQLAKKIKDRMDESLPKDASRYKIKEKLTDYILAEIRKNISERANQEGKNRSKRVSLFEGSPLHLFLLEELVSLDKLDVLELPDDFKYKGVPFFNYYKDHLVHELNKFRVNKIFRNESNRRLNIAKKVAHTVLTGEKMHHIRIVDSDGSYLFNLHLDEFFSFQDLEKFTKKLAEQHGIALIPYPKGFVRFSLGDFVEGTDESYSIFEKEFENALRIFLKYWHLFYEAKRGKDNVAGTEEILNTIFLPRSDRELVSTVLNDFSLITGLDKKRNISLKINDIKTLYHAFPSVCGVSINSIGDSRNAVFEFYENVGQCRNIIEFLSSKAFTKIYENLLPQVYRNIPPLKNLDINYVIAKYGKPTLVKYITSKLEFQPDSHLLDDPDELNTMREILLEMERILFSDAKVKILTLNANEKDIPGDLAKLEGYNRILRKYIQELMLHFNLPFELEQRDPAIEEMVEATGNRFEEITGKSLSMIDLDKALHQFIQSTRENVDIQAAGLPGRLTDPLFDTLISLLSEPGLPVITRILYLYLLQKDRSLERRLKARITKFTSKIETITGEEARLIAEDLAVKVLPDELAEIVQEITGFRTRRITASELHTWCRDIALFITGLMNRTKNNEYYHRYNHILIRLVESGFRRQNSNVNEMIQHGIVIHRNFAMENRILEEWNNGSLAWINELMARCGVIAREQSVQTHTRIATDAKKREFPFHKIDRSDGNNTEGISGGDESPNEFIKRMETRPTPEFFARRLADFARNLDEEDYRCKIVNNGLVKELYIFQKSYMKYLTDNFRLIQTETITLKEIGNFVPDIILFYGAPEKVISYPQIGYFDQRGPNGNIKTIVTPLKKSVDYFGDIKKPRLTMMNEKIKEMGGVPVHGSLFAVEEEDGSLFVIQISGDSGVGKSEMLAALMLKWMKHDLQGIRSIKLIAGDMFHLFPDKEGNLYGIGTEVGDFSRVTDFDPDFIRYYRSLFESSADSNVEDLNSRSTIGGLCDISMPYKIDIMLTAYNFAREEAGVKRYANPENFLLYRDSHGERKEKATSSDNPNIQRTLLRYTGDPNIVDVLDAHGNYLDDILAWEMDSFTGRWYLASSYKMMDKIDLEEIVHRIFIDKKFRQGGKSYLIRAVKFDIIRNRFQVIAMESGEGGQEISFLLDRRFFGMVFHSLASTPAGNPFIAEAGELEGKKHLVEILKGRPGGRGKGKNIQLGILSTDLGKKGKEITGPQKASEDVKRLIQEVRILNPQINTAKDLVKQAIDEKYQHLFKHHKQSHEVWRYNYYLYQLEQMRKAELVRIDNPAKKIDLSGLKGFKPLPRDYNFSPLLVTPNVNIELNGFSETYEQLMWLPNNREFAEDFYRDCDDIYIARGYSRETIINNMVLQLLLKNGYIASEDLARGKITEKANRETIAAAKFAVVRKLEEEEERKVNRRKK